MSDTDTVKCSKCDKRPAENGVLCTTCRDVIQNRPASDYYKDAK
ncbi:hypothetical protein AB0383_20370 [Amycolatopsis sp. NPDC051373]